MGRPCVSKSPGRTPWFTLWYGQPCQREASITGSYFTGCTKSAAASIGPLGLSSLSPFHQAKVDSANILYALAIDVILFCHNNSMVISLENPANSWLWAALVQLTLQHSTAASVAYNKLEKVLFHACCHGSTRRKLTGWLSTPGVYSALSATCQNDHPHDPWGVRWAAGSWIFDTASEAAYPVLLSQRAAACLAAVALSRGFALKPPFRLHDKAMAAQGKQSRKHPPLIPEFHHFLKHPRDVLQPPGTKQLAPHLWGSEREEQKQSGDVVLKADSFDKFCKLGVYHTPKQFLSLAQRVAHPVDTTEPWRRQHVLRWTSTLDILLR